MSESGVDETRRRSADPPIDVALNLHHDQWSGDGHRLMVVVGYSAGGPLALQLGLANERLVDDPECA